jgi:hypothetical protein
MPRLASNQAQANSCRRRSSLALYLMLRLWGSMVALRDDGCHRLTTRVKILGRLVVVGGARPSQARARALELLPSCPGLRTPGCGGHSHARHADNSRSVRIRIMIRAPSTE